MKFTVLTLFPEMFAAISEHGITSRALKQGLIELDTVNPRLFTEDKHRTVDDRPFGGGPGMLMLIEPLRKALASVMPSQDLQGSSVTSADDGEKVSNPKVVYLSPQGSVFDQAMAKRLAKEDALILIAGRYEGLDQRFIDHFVDEEISVGDFVVSGGELPAMTVIDAVSRCLPGVLGHAQSAQEDSFFDGLLDHPQYTRPEVYPLEGEEQKVPDVLLSGNHQKIRRWRLKQALGRTWSRRPDLLKARTLSDEEAQLLAEFQADNK